MNWICYLRSVVHALLYEELSALVVACRVLFDKQFDLVLCQ